MTSVDQQVGNVRCLSRLEAAKLLSISERTLFERTQPRGPIKPFRLGRRVLYRVADLERFIESNSGVNDGPEPNRTGDSSDES